METPVATLGKGLGIYANLYQDRLEVNVKKKVEGERTEFSYTLPRAKGLAGGAGYRVMTIEPGVEAELLAGGADTRSSRVTVTRVLAVGVFAPAFKKKKGHAATQLLFVANQQGEAFAIPVGPKDAAQAKMFEKAVNAAAGAAG